jgi:radical SAM protein (TIGR01212 family)
MDKYYYDLNTFLRERFGCRVQKITLDAGLTCPNRDGTVGTGGCIYCNARGSGTGASSLGLSITEQLVRAKANLGPRYGAKRFLAYFQSFTNTYAPIDVLARLYDEALTVDGVVGLCIGTRPDCAGEPVLNLLSGYAKRAMVWVEYGLQSAHDKTLAKINRGHDAACFADAVSRTRNRGILVCGHVILGLPGENIEDMRKTADFIADLGTDGVKIHLLYVVRGSGMEELYRSGAYKCLEQDEYVEAVCDFLERLPEGMVVHRLTGDPHPEELVAPLWALEPKQKTLTLIRELFEKRGSRQGKFRQPA